jgi:protein DGCR14
LRLENKRSYSSIETPAIISHGLAQETPIPNSKRPKLIEEFSEEIHGLDDSQLSQDAKSLTLDEFLTKYTSEDDASFSKLIDKEVTEARRIYHEVYDKAAMVHEKMMAEGKLIGWKGYDSTHSSVLSFPTGLALTFTAAEMKSGEKAVVPENTRFPEGGPSWNQPKQQITSASSSEPSIGGFKAPLPLTSGNLDAQLYDRLLKEKRGDFGGQNHLFENAELNGPQIKGYGMVSTPKITPSNVDASPMITWGEIDEVAKLDEFDLPVILKPSDAPSSSGFTVPAPSHRTLLANQIMKKSSGKKKDSNLKSPILTRAGGLKTPLFQMTPDTQLRSSYASPMVKSIAGRTPSRPKSGIQTNSSTPSLN